MRRTLFLPFVAWAAACSAPPAPPAPNERPVANAGQDQQVETGTRTTLELKVATRKALSHLSLGAGQPTARRLLSRQTIRCAWLLHHALFTPLS